jgi:3-hydroxybutyryl-CoA dehydrogenase
MSDQPGLVAWRVLDQFVEPVQLGAQVVLAHPSSYLIPWWRWVQAEATAGGIVQRTIALLAEVGKTPVHVRCDVPGFVGNRLQHTLWREAIAIVAAGPKGAERPAAVR